MEELAAEKAEYHGDTRLGDDDEGVIYEGEGEDIDHKVRIQLMEIKVELQSEGHEGPCGGCDGTG